MTNKKKEMPEEIWVSDINKTHCRVWGIEVYGDNGDKATKYIRADLVEQPSNEEALKAFDALAIDAEHMKFSHTKNSGDDYTDYFEVLLSEDQIKTIRQALTRPKVGVESLKKDESCIGILISNYDEEEVGYIKGWNACLDRLVEKGIIVPEGE